MYITHVIVLYVITGLRGATVLGHVASLLGRELLAPSFHDMLALLGLHVLEAVDQDHLLLLGCVVVLASWDGEGGCEETKAVG